MTFLKLEPPDPHLSRRNRIMPALAKGLAPEDAPYSKAYSPDDAMHFNCFVSIVGTGRSKTTPVNRAAN